MNSLKKQCSLFLFLLLLGNLAQALPPAIYTVTLDEDKKLAQVSLSFTAKNDTLYMAAGADQFENRWGSFVKNMKARTAAGQPIAIEELGNAHWLVSSLPNTNITLTYEVALSHQDHQWSAGIDAVSYTNEQGIFATGRTLFILPVGVDQPVSVAFLIPDSWHVTTPWDVAVNGSSSFLVSNSTELTQSMFFVGTHEELTIERGGFELILALGSEEVRSSREELSDMADGVFEYYTMLMGGSPKPAPGNTFKRSVVIINSGDETDGEVVGNSISILIGDSADPMTQVISRFIFAHEFFHLWNGKSFSPSGDDTEWFKEGFTNYYTLKALHHIGFLTDDSYLDLFSNFFYQRYSGDDGVGRLSMSNGEVKHDHWGLVYGGGMLVAIAQDMIIREGSDNTQSIDDLMRDLYKEYGGTDKHYTSEELKYRMSQLIGVDQADFFSTYVLGTSKFPVEDYLSAAGLDATVENGKLMLKINPNATAEQQKIRNGLFGKQTNL